MTDTRWILVPFLLGALAVRSSDGVVAAPTCAPRNDGLTLPAGFCAVVVGKHLGAVRHLVVAPNGDVFVNVEGPIGGVLALRDTTGDGVADLTRRFGRGGGGTGIALGDGYLYYSTDDAVFRYAWKSGQLEPSGAPEPIVRGLPGGGDHFSKTIILGPGDALYVNIGSATNSCQERNRRDRSPGKDPCTELDARAGVWRFSASRPDQSVRDGRRVATGLRNTVALALAPGTDALYGVVHGRDQLTQNWGFTPPKGAENPGEELVRIEEGDDFGWPYCYYDVDLKRLVLAPEYGGDGKETGRCAKLKEPLMAFPGHWAPLALAFGSGKQFGRAYAHGVFVAFHGSWNRSPLPQAGYRVVWAPFDGDHPTGEFSTFLVGSGGSTSIRPSGVAVGPDGSLYVAADANGTIWRIVNASPAKAAAQP
jgi:glucose/arabinose dehydrogenase